MRMLQVRHRAPARMTLEEKIIQVHGIHDATQCRLVRALPGIPELNVLQVFALVVDAHRTPQLHCPCRLSSSLHTAT